MARKSPSKPVKKPVPSPSISPSLTPSTPSADRGKEEQLKALMAETQAVPEGQPDPGATPPPAAKIEEPVPEVYRMAVYPISLGLSMVANYALKYAGCEFVPISKEQASMFEEDAAYCLKEAIDQYLPQFAKDHPRLTALIMMVGVVCASNIRPIKPKESSGSTETTVKKDGTPSPASDVPTYGTILAPVEHRVEVGV